MLGQILLTTTTSSTPWIYYLFDGLIPAIGVAIGTGIVHYLRIRRERRKKQTDENTAEAESTAERIDLMELRLMGSKELNLEGYLARTDRRLGALESDMASVKKGVSAILRELSPNGGSSLVDKINDLHARGEGNVPNSQ